MSSEGRSPPSASAVLAAVFVIAACGLSYELLAGALATYVLGDTVTQFSTIVGTYLTALGVGAWVSKRIERDLSARLVDVVISAALVGGVSGALFFLAFARLAWFRPLMYGVVLLTGVLVGVAIPLLMRVLAARYALAELVAKVLSIDYLGALVASLAFPLFIVPDLGLVRGAFAVGLLNAIAALWATFAFESGFDEKGGAIGLRIRALIVVLLMIAGIGASDKLTALAEEDLFADPIAFAKTSTYQRIVITRGKAGFQLFLNGNLQFTSTDEHRYHEALVHPGMSVIRSMTSTATKKVLILGGGDGLAVREVLKYPGVEHITLVDLDPAMTDLGKTHPFLRGQNQGALDDPRVEIVNQDAMTWLATGEARSRAPYELIVIDFPDPNSFALGKLYTTAFYRRVDRVLAADGALVVQATSPLLARRSFWCVISTIEASGLHARAYHANVPAFGEWGYVVAARRPFEIPRWLPEDAPLSYLTPDIMAGMFAFPPDMARIPAEVNRLNNQILVQYYEDEWSRYY